MKKQTREWESDQDQNTQGGLALDFRFSKPRLLVLGSIGKERDNADIIKPCLALAEVQAKLGAQQIGH